MLIVMTYCVVNATIIDIKSKPLIQFVSNFRAKYVSPGCMLSDHFPKHVQFAKLDTHGKQIIGSPQMRYKMWKKMKYFSSISTTTEMF